MKIREELNKTRKTVFLFSFLSWILFAAATVLTGTYKSDSLHTFLLAPLGFSLFILIPFGLFAFTVLYSFVGIRCPKCKGGLGYALNWPWAPGFSVSERIKFCPFCGVDLDSEI
jgi:hypothetical protein